jgi:outer membrane protein, multidrug efflux system
VFLNLFTFEIDIWGRLRRATEAARADLLGADWARKAMVTILIGDVATAYFSLLELDMEREIAINTLSAREESLRVIRIQQQGGVAILLDVRQAEQLAYTAAQAIPDAERQIEQTENQIRFLLGQNPGSISRNRRCAIRCRDSK